MFADDNVHIKDKIGTGKKMEQRPHEAVTSGSNITHSLCTPQGDFLITSDYTGHGATKMRQCLFIGQMTQNDHRRDDNACEMKMLSTREKKEKKRKHNLKLHKLVLVYKAISISILSPIPPWKITQPQ